MLRKREVQISKHAMERMWERDVRESEVRAVLEIGHREHRSDSLRYRVDEVGLDSASDPSEVNLVGIIVVVSLDESTVKTVIRKAPRRYPDAVIEHLESAPLAFTMRDALNASTGEQ